MSTWTEGPITASTDSMDQGNATELNYTFNETGIDIIHQPGVQAIFSLLYLTIFVMGLFGNVLVCYVVCRNKAMQTVTNFFITNLALADILLIMLAVPFTPLYTFLQEWIFGRILCHLVPYAQGTSVYISTLTLTSIAIDRYFVIIYPFKPRMRLTTCLFIITSIWVFALISTLPYGIWLTYEFEVKDTKYICSESWPSEGIRQVFSGFTATMQYILPFLLITFCYIRVSLKLSDRARCKPGSKNSKKEAIERERKRRTNRMLIAMVLIFGLSWLPLNLANLLNDVIAADHWEYYDLCFFVAHALAMSSTCYNPFLYAWLNENFRKEFKQVLPCFNTAQPEGNRVRRFLSERTCNGNETVQESFIPTTSQPAPTLKPNVTVLETIEEQTSTSQTTTIAHNYDQITAKYCTTTNEVEIHIPEAISECPASGDQSDENRANDDDEVDPNYAHGPNDEEEAALTAQV